MLGPRIPPGRRHRCLSASLVGGLSNHRSWPFFLLTHFNAPRWMPRLLSQPSRNVEPFRPACRYRKCTPRLFVPKQPSRGELRDRSGQPPYPVGTEMRRRRTARRAHYAPLRSLATAPTGTGWQCQGRGRTRSIIGEVQRDRPTSSQRDMGAGRGAGRAGVAAVTTTSRW